MGIQNIIKDFQLELAQIAWVVSDIEVSKKFFASTFGISFPPPSVTRLAEFKSTYYGELTSGESLVSQTYNGHAFIELIQPLSGPSVFMDYLKNNPSGGVQHIAYRLPIIGLEGIIKKFAEHGYPVVSRFDTPIADIVFFDTTKQLGVMTEIMGITDEGWKMIEQMK